MIALCATLLAGWPLAGIALQTDRQQPLEVNADSTNGILGDGVTVLNGNVEIRQGTLQIRADSAEVDKTDGKVRTITLRGDSAHLQQQIEDMGLVRARARVIEYQVGSGMVLLNGGAEVEHPQYAVSGEQLRYDLNLQHFEGMGGENGNGRVHIRLDPEVAPVPADDPGSDNEPDSTDGSDPGAPGR
ncbi:MAG: lipopolysaccharide transport periplasmic protein LptA [Xanthomonadales bacterium]|nr:lipopolysaccharide transport periplasmic protein LptA [Xanthomonadales bacterium]